MHLTLLQARSCGPTPREIEFCRHQRWLTAWSILVLLTINSMPSISLARPRRKLKESYNRYKDDKKLISFRIEGSNDRSAMVLFAAWTGSKVYLLSGYLDCNPTKKRPPTNSPPPCYSISL